jgi:predicted DCC family thiol-disulfide oxidoreductase YuxK
VETIFYDGHCALCHAVVRFTAEHDRDARFLFAPLHGDCFRESVPEKDWAALPDSVVVRTGEGQLLTRGAAVGHILRHLGQPWQFFAALAALLPARALDALYDRAAAARRRRLPPPATSCPLVPQELRSRFRA